jgi:hypothetical protein
VYLGTEWGRDTLEGSPQGITSVLRHESKGKVDEKGSTQRVTGLLTGTAKQRMRVEEAGDRGREIEKGRWFD